MRLILSAAFALALIGAKGKKHNRNQKNIKQHNRSLELVKPEILEHKKKQLAEWHHVDGPRCYDKGGK